MSRRAQENLLACVVGCVFVGYLLIAIGFGPNARLVPVPIAAIGLLCLLIQVIRQNREGGLEKNKFSPLSLLTGDKTPEKPASDEHEKRTPSPAATRSAARELQAFGFVALFTLLIVGLGPVPAVFVFAAGYLAISRHFPFWKAIASAAVFSIALYLLFVVALELQLYHGLLEPLIDRF